MEGRERLLNKECDVCHRRFTRSEHLIRHRRTHTKERPFACEDCGKSFPRHDVKNLHIRRFHPWRLQQQGHHQQFPEDSQKSRVRVACNNCRRRKIRCSSSIPCAQCSGSALLCTNSSLGPNSENIPTLIPDSERHEARSQLETPLLAGAEVNSEGGIHPLNSFGSIMAEHEAGLADDFGPTDIPGSTGVALYDTSWLTTPVDNAFWLDTAYQEYTTALNTLPVFAATSNCNSPGPASIPQMTSISSGCAGQLPCWSLGVDNDQAWQCSKPPSLEIYDRDVVNVFLNIFHDHIPAFFPIFKDNPPLDVNRPDYYLSMAAVGALYCSVEGSYEIARAMYNDARRMILEAASSLVHATESSSDLDNALIDVRIFLLLEIYGLCSGDRRSYELAEAHHVDLHFSWPFNGSAPSRFTRSGAANQVKTSGSWSLYTPSNCTE
ncbi:hypothetical protein BDV29DRAFT_92665 [Aspergillus leporis]|uniref:Zn(2)-C6 fungal-type domain-containing protein n=1 Tax=Aspergillus leporis TaxID=41062 RepID=A0A5N5WJ79_9EURO|nr:hypothetical protein BDV29DRAFT_92665 [Aspergillus leporis]